MFRRILAQMKLSADFTIFFQRIYIHSHLRGFPSSHTPRIVFRASNDRNWVDWLYWSYATVTQGLMDFMEAKFSANHFDCNSRLRCRQCKCYIPTRL